LITRKYSAFGSAVITKFTAVLHDQNYHHRQHKTVVPGVLVLDKPELETPTGLNEVPDPIGYLLWL
jgi:hypothetical protein